MLYLLGGEFIPTFIGSFSVCLFYEVRFHPISSFSEKRAKKFHADEGVTGQFWLVLSDWSCRVGNFLQPIRCTTQMWYNMSTIVPCNVISRGNHCGGFARCRLFPQAI